MAGIVQCVLSTLHVRQLGLLLSLLLTNGDPVGDGRKIGRDTLGVICAKDAEKGRFIVVVELTVLMKIIHKNKKCAYIYIYAYLHK
jgi:hypothetical protein